jgi:hypothetical protein
MVDGGGGSTPEPTPTAMGGGTMLGVNPENVLKVAAELEFQAKDLQKKVARRATSMNSAAAYDFPASQDVSKALLTKLVEAPDSYINRANQSVDELLKAANSLKAVAKRYGHTDDEIASALKVRTENQSV